MPDAVHELVATEAAESKLAARSISMVEARQTLLNGPVITRNVRGRAGHRERRVRRALHGITNGGRALTLVVEATIDPTTWLLITGWEATATERKIAER
jgi:hypothetical protein